jgi:transposase
VVVFLALPAFTRMHQHLWVPKTYATWADALRSAGRFRPVSGGWKAGQGVGDLRLVGLKLIFLMASRAVSLLGLSRRESWWKDAEILMLRHQLAVAERERPRARAQLTWPDRAWLALLAGTLPIERLAAMRLIVTPGTILRWHREIVRRRWARRSRRGRSGRPATHRKVRSQVLRLARENESWGYRRIHGELAGLGITVAPSTVWQILKNAGIDPAPRRDGPNWAGFLRSQAQGILALDFFTADLLNGMKVYVLAVIEHGTRRVRVLGATGHPVQSWVVQQARNLLMDLEDAGTRVKFVLHDRDASFTAAFDAVSQSAGVRVIRSAVQAPRMNSVMERWIGSCRRELLDRTLVWNQRHLMIVLREYEDFYNAHRPHRALKQAAPLRPLPDGVADFNQFRVQRRYRAGGVIHE